ncbi:MAG: MATE family efflux transporter [Bacilli bacterium]
MEKVIKQDSYFNLAKRILLFSLPLMLSGFLQLLYNAADLIVVGQFSGAYSDLSLAGVGATSSLISLIFNLFFGLSIGANIVMSNCYGAKNEEKAQLSLHSSLLLSLICGVILGIIGIILSKQLLILTSCDEEVLPYATLYLRIYLIGAPANILYNFAQGNLRAIGDTKTPLYILAASGLINVLLNMLFVICFKMNVAGVALATIISQYLSAFSIMLFLSKIKNPYVHFSFSKLKLSKEVTQELIVNGIPAGIQSSVFSLSNVIIQSAINGFGKYVIAGKTAAFSIDNFVYQAMNSFYTACIVFTGQGYGEKNIKKMKKVFWICNFFVVYIALFMSSIIILNSEFFLGLYTSTAESLYAGQQVMFTVLPLYFLCGLNEVSCAELRSLKHPLIPTIISITFICGFRVLWIYTYFASHKSIEVLYFSYIISWSLAWITHFCLYYFLRNKSYEKMMKIK